MYLKYYESVKIQMRIKMFHSSTGSFLSATGVNQVNLAIYALKGTHLKLGACATNPHVFGFQKYAKLQIAIAINIWGFAR
jgi:hypothetical protein